MRRSFIKWFYGLALLVIFWSRLWFGSEHGVFFPIFARSIGVSMVFVLVSFSHSHSYWINLLKILLFLVFLWDYFFLESYVIFIWRSVLGGIIKLHYSCTSRFHTAVFLWIICEIFVLLSSLEVNIMLSTRLSNVGIIFLKHSRFMSYSYPDHQMLSIHRTSISRDFGHNEVNILHAITRTWQNPLPYWI